MELFRASMSVLLTSEFRYNPALKGRVMDAAEHRFLSCGYVRTDLNNLFLWSGCFVPGGYALQLNALF
jgi:hypothetical protein